jgi:MerR family transcriptional regulator, copper efflux regulator
MRSGTLARQAHISVDTLRHYERLGLLAAPPRTQGGYREYPAQSLQRVMLIQRALALGFSLTELRDILEERDKGGAPCARVALLARTKLAQLDAELRELRVLRRDMARIIRDWNARIAKLPKGRPARLLESLADGRPQKRANFKRGIRRGARRRR